MSVMSASRQGGRGLLTLLSLVLATGCVGANRAQGPTRDGSESDLIVFAYFMKDVPKGTLPGGFFYPDGRDLPGSHREFDSETDDKVVFFSALKQRYRHLRLRLLLYDPKGALARTFTTNPDQTTSSATDWTTATRQVIPMDWLRGSPGTWKLELFIDDKLAGRYPFNLKSPLADRTAPGVRAERPELRVGDRWVRSDGVREIVTIDDTGYVYRDAGGETHLTPDLALIKTIRSGKVVRSYDPPAPLFQWPLEVGKRWPVKTRIFEAATGEQRESEWTGEVVAYENVTVPAGTFKAFKISFGRTTYWYSSEARAVVKSISNEPIFNYELVALDLGPRESPFTGKPPSPPPVAALPPADTQAPTIVLNYPPPKTKVEREQIVVLGLVTDDVEVAHVQVTVNGVEAAQPRDIAAAGKGVTVRVPAALQPGDNVIEVTARDRAGNVAQLVRTVTRVAPVVAAPPAPKVGGRWAVVIGIGEYDHAGIPRLRYATRDAEAMYRFLTTQGGYPKDNVLLLTDTTPDKPTLQNIRRALGDFLYRKPGRDDMVLIYFAGHGAPEVDAVGAESDGLSKYLIPRNADPDSLYSSAFPMDEIQRIFARIPAERVVMLLDTCYSGTAGGRTFARQQVRATGISDQFLERLTRSKGRVIMTASGPNEVALEAPELGHGIFTYYLLEGLAGKADRNGDGVITVSELYEYVEEQVEKKARATGGRQRPLMKGEIEGALPLAWVGK